MVEEVEVVDLEHEVERNERRCLGGNNSGGTCPCTTGGVTGSGCSCIIDGARLRLV